MLQKPEFVWPVVSLAFIALLAAAPSHAADPAKPAPGAVAATQAPVPAPLAPSAASSAKAIADAAAQARLAEIDTARARCTALLKTISAVAIPKDTIEEGECGALAPVELISIGRNPEVALSPPAIVTCDLAVALHDWIKTDVQPLAKTHLGREVVRIETMSSYACRNAYGRTKNKLSEHGKANALDIRGFVTAGAQTAYVLSDWGMTSGEIRAAVAVAEKDKAAKDAAIAAQADAEAKARAMAAANTQGKPGTASGGAAPDPLAVTQTLIEGLSKPPLGASDAKPATGFGLAAPNRLGGPKARKDGSKDTGRAGHDAEPAAPVPMAAYVAPDGHPLDAKSQFLRAVHASACRRFGTTLGPESNAAHRNHFHVDLAERKSKLICE
jgi:hypothetical protein